MAADAQQNGLEQKDAQEPQEPRGFGEHSRGLSGEYAHEQGWGLDVDERTKIPTGPQDISGGKDYDYGARDFGDEPVNTERAGTGDGPDEKAARRALDIEDQSSTTKEK